MMSMSPLMIRKPNKRRRWKLVWSDEFSGAAGALDSAKWKYEEGFQRNHEDQYYIKSGNARLDGKGHLVITAKRQRIANPAFEAGSPDWKKNRQFAEYTSASVQSKFTYRYGRVLVRARIPVSSGAWPAIWQVGNRYEWPLGGEIDIMESYPSNGHQALHANFCWGTDQRWKGHWKSRAIPYTHFTEKDKNWFEKYHIWRLDWTEESLKIYIDDELVNEISTSLTVNGSGGGYAGQYENPFRNQTEGFGNLIWLNLAIGGDNGGVIDNRAFPHEL